MQLKHHNLFRQEALDRLSSPEQLDQVMQVINPQAWLPLSTLGFLVVIAGVWSVFGRIPLTVSGQGILIRPHRIVQFQTPSSGQLLALNVKPGDVVKQGDVLGIIDQSALKQQLQQEQTKLAELQTQNQDTDKLQQQLIDQQIRILQQQRIDLENNLSREQTAPDQRNQTLAVISEKQKSLESRRQQISNLLRSFQIRIDKRRRLYQEHVITEDLFVQSEQEYFNAQTQLSDTEIQLKDLEIQITNVEREYLQNLNKIDETKTKIKDLDAQETKLIEQRLKQSIDNTNQVREAKRRIAQLELRLASQGRVISKYDGHVLEIGVVPGQIIEAGTRLGSLEAEDSRSKLVSVAYFANQDGEQIKPGMSVQVTPSSAKRERDGGIVGKVTTLSPFPVTTQDIAAIVGNTEIATNLASKGEGQIQAFVQLEEDPTTMSGYKWSSSKGIPSKLFSGTTTSVQVKVGERAPISYIIPMLRSWTGIY